MKRQSTKFKGTKKGSEIESENGKDQKKYDEDFKKNGSSCRMLVKDGEGNSGRL